MRSFDARAARRALRSAPLALALTVALTLTCLAPRGAEAAEPAPPASASVAVADVAPDSPRASVQRFLELCGAGEYAEAAAYLDLAEADRADGPNLAKRLKAVLDRELWVKPEALSPAPHGNPADALPPGVDEVGAIRTPSGAEPVRIVRRAAPEGARWVFTRSTVEHIGDWYGRLRDRWLQDYLPEALLRRGPRELAWWQWIALPVLALGAFALGRLLSLITRKVLRPIVVRTKTTWDDDILEGAGGPLALLWAILTAAIAVPYIGFFPPAEAALDRVTHAGLLLALFWFVTGCIDVAAKHVAVLSGENANPATHSLLTLGGRITKITVLSVGAVAVLSTLGFPVTSLLAGLGVGGVVVALAAQKTVENLFGSVAIGIDQPFRVGDFVVVDGISGTVEAIGLRSTRVRSLDRTIITIPNGKLADMRVESLADRDRMRVQVVLGLERSTPSAVVRAVLDGARAALEADENVWPEHWIGLARIGDVSLDVELTLWVKVTTWLELLPLRSGILLGLLEVVERAGARLAVPIHVVRSADDAAAKSGL